LGGKVYKEPEDIPTVGRYAVVGDPQGTPISVFKPAQAMTLHDTTKEGEACWNELLTSNMKSAFEFYAKLFGWQILQDMDMGPMGTYRLYGIGEKRFGGMMTVPQETPPPPMWMIYFETKDLDAATARATKRGAKVMNGPMDVPGGRMIQMMDPQGA